MSDQTGASTDTSLRSRSFTWVDPASAQASMAGLSGLEIMRGIRDGTLPAPPMARLIGFRCALAEPGEIIMEIEPREDLLNPMGLVHGATAAALLDTAMGAAAHTLLPAGSAAVTLDIKLTFLRPLTLGSGLVRATGRVMNKGRQNIYVEGFVRDGRDSLAAHAVGTFSIVNGH